MAHTSTHTYVTMPVTQRTFDEIFDKLQAAGYAGQIHEQDGNKWLIDMHGLALVVEPPQEEVPPHMRCPKCREGKWQQRGHEWVCASCGYQATKPTPASPVTQQPAKDEIEDDPVELICHMIQDTLEGGSPSASTKVQLREALTKFVKEMKS